MTGLENAPKRPVLLKRTTQQAGIAWSAPVTLLIWRAPGPPGTNSTIGCVRLGRLTSKMARMSDFTCRATFFNLVPRACVPFGQHQEKWTTAFGHRSPKKRGLWERDWTCFPFGWQVVNWKNFIVRLSSGREVLVRLTAMVNRSVRLLLCSWNYSFNATGIA